MDLHQRLYKYALLKVTDAHKRPPGESQIDYYLVKRELKIIFSETLAQIGNKDNS